MEEKYRVWNNFHDGEITAISRNLSKIQIRVSIPYLREMFCCNGDGFWITLHGCRKFEFLDYEQGRVLTFSKIIRLETEILSVMQKGRQFSVICCDGTLRLEYHRISLRLDTGKTIHLEELNHASNRYWNEWEKRAKDI